MRSTRYFRDQVLRKRPYLKEEWLNRAARSPLFRETQADGRVRAWIYAEEVGKYVRVIFMEGGEVVHNAFYDRRFRGGKP